MEQERWDVVLRVLDGPLSAAGELVLKGPVVPVGASPGPGGLQLTGYRGLDARQCVLTAYDGGTASVAPVGSLQVRMGPHPHVDWAAIDPISGPQHLSEGCALHLGPVGRGATLQFVGLRRLGAWTAGQLASEAVDAGSADARRVGRLRASSAPIWFLGCLFLMATGTSVGVGVGAWLILNQPEIAPLGPKEEGSEWYPSVARLDPEHLDPDLLQGVDRAFADLVVQPNAEASGRQAIAAPEAWDRAFHDYTMAAVNQYLSAWAVFRRLELVRDDYERVTGWVREAGLPEVLAAIPYQESRYDPHAQSAVCAKGYWQFMPEVALRVQTDFGLPFRVSGCRFQDAAITDWAPTLLTPPRPRDRAYTAGDRCRIPARDGCAVDDRTDLEKSTRAALAVLGEAFRDPVVQGSGAATEIAILSHNAGYDDARFGLPRATNLLPAFQAWAAEVDPADHHRFYGENIRCAAHDTAGLCGSVLPAETQHYAYNVVAIHILAVCYYGASYGDRPAFREWGTRYTGEGRYCAHLNVPTAERVRAWMSSGGEG